MLVLWLALAASSPIADRLGVMVSDRPSAFINLGPLHRAFARPDGKPCATDAQGWPKEDGSTVLMDDRPTFAWAPPMDDPAQFQPEESGTYTLQFSGQADVTAEANPQVHVKNLKYDAARNESTAEVVLPKGAPNLIVLNFRATRRSHEQPEGTGIANLRFVRPGYPVATSELFTSNFLNSLKPFKFLRFMGWQDTNYQAGYYGDVGHHLIRWENRTQITDSYWGEQRVRPGAVGYPIELYIQLCNRLKKDLWINVPIAATGSSVEDTSSYVYQLAKLIRDGDAFTAGLDPNLKIYVEHSNEVWNFGFSQYIWNKLAAVDEAAHTKTTLNNDGTTDPEELAHRRHGKRLFEIAKIFERVFGPGSLRKRVYPVYASWTISPNAHYEKVLDWMTKTYGPVKNYFDSISITGYFNEEHVGKDASVSQVLDGMNKSVDGIATYTRQFRALADRYGLKLSAYEAGPDNGGGNAMNIGNRIRANRDPRMGDMVKRAFGQAMFGAGMDYAVYFAQASSFSRFGCWGAVEDTKQLDTPKYRAILELVGSTIPVDAPPTAKERGVVPAPTNLVARRDGTTVELTWSPVTGATYTVWMSTGGNFVLLKDHLKEPHLDRIEPGAGTVSFYVTAEIGKLRSIPSNAVTL